MDFEKLFSQGNRLARRATGFVLKRDVEFLCEKLYRFGEFEILQLHGEGEAVAAFASAKAFIKSAVRMYIKGRCFFLCERTEPFP